MADNRGVDVADGTCTVDGCDAALYCKGLCSKHYARKWRLGSPTAGRTSLKGASPEIRFWAKVDRTGDCWMWTAGLTNSGYGQFHIKRDGQWMPTPAHRFAYELLIGPIPDGLVLDHLCRNRTCVNPKHLEPVTDKVNILRGEGWSGRHARKTKCPQGHAYNAANTYVSKAGARHCRVCNTIRARQYRRRNASS